MMTNAEIDQSIPDTLKACQDGIDRILRYVFNREHIFIDDVRWTEGHWFRRDESGRLYLVAGLFKKGTSVVVIDFERGILLMGRLGTPDETITGQIIEPIVDRLGV